MSVKWLRFLPIVIAFTLLQACSTLPHTVTMPKPPNSATSATMATKTTASPQPRPASETLQTLTSSQSPNGAWSAVVRTNLQAGNAVESFYVELQVTSSDGQTVQTPIAEERAYGLGYVTPAIVAWAPQSQALYYTEVAHPDGCALFNGGVGLWRLDLPSGKVTQVLMDAQNPTLAPDGQTIAYSGGAQDDKLLLLDLQTDKTHTIQVTMLEPGAQWGNFIWSPDSQKVALTIAYAPCQPPAWRHSIVVLDTTKMTMIPFVAKDLRRLITTTWIDASQLMLIDQQQQQWVLDVQTGTVTTANRLTTEANASLSPLPTPSPTPEPTPVIIPATAKQRPTFSQDLLFVNAQGVQYWNHRTNQIDTLAAPTLGATPNIVPIVERQAGPGLPIGTITTLSASRSGQKIAFVRYMGISNGQEYYRIEVYDRATAQTIIVLPTVTGLFTVALSTNGEWIAYLTQDIGQTAHKPHGLAAPMPAPHSGDGSPSATVWLIRTDGMEHAKQVGTCRGPVSLDLKVQCVHNLLWSADNQLAWADSAGLWVATTETDSAKLIAPNVVTLPTSIKAYTPWAWSPSGRYLFARLNYYEGNSQAVIDSKTRQVVEVADSFEYINPGVRLTWLTDDRVALVRPAQLYMQTKPTLEFWSLQDNDNLQLRLDLSVTIPVASESIPFALSQFTNGNLGFAVLNSHPDSQLERGLFLWDHQQFRRVNALPLAAEDPALLGRAHLSGQFYWSPDGTGTIWQDFDFGYLLYVPTDNTPLYDLKPLLGSNVWGLTWLPNQ